MFSLIILVVLFFWAALSFLIWNSVRKVAEKRFKRLAVADAKAKAIKLIIYCVIFLIPFWPRIILHYYQVATTPFVCERLAGYKPYNPVKITSIRTWYNPLSYIQFQGVKFTEWEYTENNRHVYAKEFDVGKYRLKFYQNGSPECTILSSHIADLDSRLEAQRSNYSRAGYQVKDTNNICLGIEKISEFTYEYHIQKSNSNNYIDSGFGYRVRDQITQLADRQTNNVVSRFHEITFGSPHPFYSYLFDYTSLRKDCVSSYEKYFGREIQEDGNFGPLKIERGFFMQD